MYRTCPSRALLALLLAFVGVGCAQGTGQGAASAGRAEADDAEAGAEAGAETAETTHGADGAAHPTAGVPSAAAESPAAPTEPRYAPELVRSAIDHTAEASEPRARLGLRLAVLERGPEAPWLIAVVNRGTEPLTVRPDLRTLVLEVTAPVDPVDPKKRAVRPPKLVRCSLPKDLVPSAEDLSPEVKLAPGEGLLDSFDPRLYCLPGADKSVLVPGASVVARLGWPEKTRKVWRQGKSSLVPLEQSAPFLARRELPADALPPAPEGKPLERAVDAPPRSDEIAVKEVLTQPFTLGADYAPIVEAPDSNPLSLEVSRSADARTERDAVLSVSVTNRSKKSQRLLFRREFVSFEVSGPDGLVACEPGPDDRAPDRSGISALRPGGRLRAASRLIELCPRGALRRPGLYLIHARYESRLEGEGAEGAFNGRLVSRQPAVLRVRRGWGTLPPQREPERIRVGSAPQAP